MKTLARIIVSLYVMATATVLILAGVALMALPFVSAHFRPLQISDVHLYSTGAILLVTGLTFIYGIDPEEEEERLALPSGEAQLAL